ncbi:ABC transporter ATP-binding protein [Parapedobacter sp. ISTM3]|uniref:ABC-type Fe3+/spermidine/putrescine transport systems, ATPase components n=1 Tax=Parapedobacter luteus TaxID=623280 RepID=A0A1T5F9X0_9SPHI|nr:MULTISPECIES: ABC transporter ATP-binding protein [Parapedobacter]MBK1442066.1 ABC transporter ATP-binding protein [Parapedobacter sp. ISTM3]SKB92858.1 ABC-type Fe3+/spermidine/putrescine transport systems, ATPase components [Parapedobacter luteus]
MVSIPTTPPSCSVPNDVHRDGLPLIHGENLSRSFQAKEPVVAVNGLTFGIAEAQVTAIIGESGSGKSTMLRLIYGLLEPDEGEVRYRGWRVPNPREKLIPGHDAMRMVSQGFDDLNTYANVWDNVASQLPNTDLAVKFSRTEATLHRLRIAHLTKQRIADLSGGEKQRVAIARALVREPEVLLMDEPFNQVDASFRETLQRDIRHIVDETGLTVVLVSHDPAEVLSMADQLIVLRHGHLVAADEPALLYRQPPDSYTARLLAKSNILTNAEASALGIITDATTVIVHPEWLSLEESPHASFHVVDIQFKGFYQVVAVQDTSLSLQVIVSSVTDLRKGMRVSVRIKRFHTNDAS